MKRCKNKFLTILLLCVIIVSLGTSKLNANEIKMQEFQGKSCTNFSINFGDRVLFGNSEDASGEHPLMKNPEGGYIFVYPNSSAGYGCVFLGWYWQEIYVSVQGGMNEKGLCYDSTAVPDLPMNPHPERPYKMGEDSLSSKVLRECSSVDEAIELVNKFEFESLWFQLFFTDASGDSAILSPGLNGEIVVTRQLSENSYLAQTNFNRDNPESHYGKYPCPRYDRAVEMLKDIDLEESVSVSVFEEILDEVHVGSYQGYTAYSNICDPKNKMMYLYFLSQFDEMVCFNVTEELEKGERGIKISELFSDETVTEGLELYSKYRRQFYTIVSFASLSGILLVGSVIVIPLTLIQKRKRRKS